MSFNENTRVKIPAILHLCRFGFNYLSIFTAKRDETTNIFTDLFSESIKRINPDLEDDEIKRLQENISLALDNEDLGEAFYKMLTASSGIKLIDFNDFNKNSFHVVTELTYKNGDDEFRPDITLLVNGMPLAFVEVKKPNNHEGILAERDRINVRFKNKKFRKFINISQVLVFSNNMEYDQESIEPIQGAFYSYTSFSEANFNCFREEEDLNLSILMDASKLGTTVKEGKNQKTLLSPEEEDLIIKTFNEHKAVEDFTVVVSYEQIKEKNYSLSAGQYFDVKIEYTDITSAEFEKKIGEYKNNFAKLFGVSKDLEKEIKKQLAGLKYEQ